MDNLFEAMCFRFYGGGKGWKERMADDLDITPMTARKYLKEPPTPIRQLMTLKYQAKFGDHDAPSL